MAILRSTQVQGQLDVIDSDVYVTGSGKFIHGNLKGTASVAEGLDPTKDIVIGSTEATHSLTVNGNLKVTGDVVYTDTANLRVKDKNIELNVKEDGTAAGSRADASGAGITVKAVKADGTEEDVTLTYDSTKNAWTSNVPFDVTNTSGTVAKAEHANEASKVTHKLKNGTGISTFTFDGSADATVQVDDSHIQAVAKAVKVDKATSADNATTAGTASKTVGKLTVADNDYITLDGGFDGSKNAEIKVNLTDVAKQADVTAVSEKVTALEGTVSANKTAAETALATAKKDLQAGIDTKVDKVAGKSLVSDTEITKLGTVQEGANKTVVDSALSETSTNPVQNKVVAEKINALWAQQFPISVTAQASPSSYEFDGTTKSIKVTWTAINGKATAVTINGTAVSVADGSAATGSETYGKSNQGSTSYAVKATIDGKEYSATATANAWLPCYIGCVAVENVDDLTLAALTKKGSSLKTTVTVSNPKGSSSDKYYTWFIMPSSQTISKVTSSGFGVPIKAVVTKKFTVGKQEFTYNCYRTEGDVTPASVTYVCA